MPGARRRLTGDQRRTHVIQAGVHEFAEHGYHAASTAAIARRAGVSQPYIYALFADKKTLFLTCQLHGYAAAGDPEIRDAVAAGYRELFDEIVTITGAPAPRRALLRRRHVPQRRRPSRPARHLPPPPTTRTVTFAQRSRSWSGR
ncbi:hypothetical protein BH23ACT10_BH23ACT10_25000 [soil metagenome]